MRHAYLTRARFARVLLVLAAVLAASMLLSAGLGSEPIDLVGGLLGRSCAEAVSGWQWLSCRYVDNVDATILWRVRVPRLLLAAVVGGALAAAGAVLQALLRNPLAEPHLLERSRVSSQQNDLATQDSFTCLHTTPHTFCSQHACRLVSVNTTKDYQSWTRQRPAKGRN